MSLLANKKNFYDYSEEIQVNSLWLDQESKPEKQSCENWFAKRCCLSYSEKQQRNKNARKNAQNRQRTENGQKPWDDCSWAQLGSAMIMDRTRPNWRRLVRSLKSREKWENRMQWKGRTIWAEALICPGKPAVLSRRKQQAKRETFRLLVMRHCPSFPQVFAWERSGTWKLGFAEPLLKPLWKKFLACCRQKTVVVFMTWSVEIALVSSSPGLEPGGTHAICPRYVGFSKAP